MSSIDARTRAAAEDLFDTTLLPLAEEMAARGASVMPLQPDQSKETYYVTRSRAAMVRDDFMAPSCSDVDDFERRLAAHWRALGGDREVLAAAAPRFAQAARASYALDEQDAEVNPFVYVMF